MEEDSSSAASRKGRASDEEEEEEVEEGGKEMREFEIERVREENAGRMPVLRSGREEVG